MLVYAANTYYWKRYRVNYPFLFGFRAGTELDYRQIFLLTSGLAVVALLCFLINLQIEMNSRSQQYKTLTELVPLILVVVRFNQLLDHFKYSFKSTSCLVHSSSPKFSLSNSIY